MDQALIHIQAGQKIIERRQNIPAEGTSLRAQREKNQEKADLKVIQEAHAYYEKTLKEEREIRVLVSLAEKHLSYRPVMVRSSREEEQLKKFASLSAERIENFKDQYAVPDTGFYRRLNRAQEFYERIQFTTPREVFDRLKAGLEHRSRRYLELKQRIAEVNKRRALN